MAMAKEQIRQIISENNIGSVEDVYIPLKDGFKDILQGLWQRNGMPSSVIPKTRRTILKLTTKGTNVAKDKIRRL